LVEGKEVSGRFSIWFGAVFWVALCSIYADVSRWFDETFWWVLFTVRSTCKRM